MRSILITLACLALASLTAGQLSFAADPTLTKDGEGRYWVEFELSTAADVAVSIVNPRDSSVVRRLAAGMLGVNAPAPLASNDLHQRLEWDGADDAGNAVASPDSMAARVRAGMSVRLVNLVGENLYRLTATFGGIVPGPEGTVYVYGSSGSACPDPITNAYIRQYDASGNYLRTVFPPPADLPLDSVTGYGVNVLPGGGWAPKTTVIYGPKVTNSFCNRTTAKMLPIGQPGELVLVDGTEMQTMTEGGASISAGTRQILTGPAGPSGYGGMGPRYFTASASPDYLYLSGWYYGTMDGGCWLIDACDTGFWADGQVFKVSRSTGTATPFVKVDSVPVNKTLRLAKLGGEANATATLHGVAIDDSGHIFVCDRLHRQISVYDTNAVLLGAVPCANPDFVSVSKRTGAIYVITRTDGAMGLAKFNGWRNPAAAVATTPLTQSINTYTGAPTMMLTESGNTTIIWCGYLSFGLRQYRDEGSSFTLVRDFSLGEGNLIYDCIAVDPATERLYTTDAWSNIYKVEDWGNPFFTRCSTSANQLLYGGDMAVAPNGLLYVRSGNTYDGPVMRYTQDHRHAPAPYANTGANTATGSLLGRFGAAWGDKGFSVNAAGKIAAISMDAWNVYNCHLYPDTGYADTSYRGELIVAPMSARCGGIKIDRDNNIYLGMHIMAPDRLVPSGWEADWGFSMTGAVAKYAPGATGSVSGTTAAGAAKVYAQPYGAFSADGGSSCLCRSPRFDVDLYGRLIIPSGATGRVTVADNAGNTILSFGEYGNTDSRGPLSGPGTPMAEPSIPLAWPIAAAATEDYVYVNDWVNSRVARVKMEYELDNMPGLTENLPAVTAAGAWQGLSLASAPNPFHGTSILRVFMPRAGTASVKVYDLNGRLIKNLSGDRLKAGSSVLLWQGDNQAGVKVAAGVYVYRLTVGKRVLVRKTVLAK